MLRDVAERYREELAHLPRPDYEDFIIRRTRDIRRDITKAIPDADLELVCRWFSDREEARLDRNIAVLLRKKAMSLTTARAIFLLWA